MKKLYIKFIEGDQDSLDKACKEAERLGYKKWNKHNALNFEGHGILSLNQSGYYCTTVNPEWILIAGHKEHKIQQEETFEPGEQVAVSSNSKENAIRDLETDSTEYFYIGKNRDGKYVVEIGNRYNHYSDFEFIAKIPQVKKRKIKCTDAQFEEIKKILNNK